MIFKSTHYTTRITLNVSQTGSTVASQLGFEMGSLVWRAGSLPIKPSGPANSNKHTSIFFKFCLYLKLLSSFIKFFQTAFQQCSIFFKFSLNIFPNFQMVFSNFFIFLSNIIYVFSNSLKIPKLDFHCYECATYLI